MTSSKRFRVLIADDEENVVRCYLRTFQAYRDRQPAGDLEELDARLFSGGAVKPPAEATFDVVTCSQGDESVAVFRKALAESAAFHAVILDVRMPPGISGIEAGRMIRELDSNVLLVFVTGFSDVAEHDLVRLIPPRSKLLYLSKPLSFRKLVPDLANLLT